MILSWFWAIIMVISLLFGILSGTLEAVSSAAAAGAAKGVELCVAMAGPLCLWSGVMEVMTRSGALGWLSAGLQRLLRVIYPDFRDNSQVMEAISGNVSANLLGLGNAATPFGIRAACAMAEGCGGVAPDDLCMLVVCNTASIQLIPTTVAALRSGAGSEQPFDILPAVWLASAVSVGVGIAAARLLRLFWREG